VVLACEVVFCDYSSYLGGLVGGFALEVLDP
jgi:hypothetical protein